MTDLWTQGAWLGCVFVGNLQQEGVLDISNSRPDEAGLV